MKVELKVYDGVKYEISSQVKSRLTYDMDRFEIIHAADDENIEANFTEEELDPFDEYLVLHLTDGDTATFRNSYCDLFNASDSFYIARA